VSGRLDLSENVGDLALLVYEEGGAFDAHVLAPVHALFFPHTVSFGDGVFRICHQDERQAVFGRKLLLARRFVGRNADHDGVLGGKSILGIAKLARFGSASGRIRLREEEYDHALALEGRKRKFRSFNVWRLLTHLDRHTS
jgi:hypothetical protein